MRDLTLETLQQIVKDDAKGRYRLVLEADPSTGEEVWWIRANQGHSMKASPLCTYYLYQFFTSGLVCGIGLGAHRISGFYTDGYRGARH